MKSIAGRNMMKKVNLLLLVLFSFLFLVPVHCIAFTHSEFNESNYVVEKHSGYFKLYTVNKSAIAEFVFGSYRNPVGVLEGHDIHIFPNMKYILTEWYDLCRTKVIDYGTWKIKDNIIYFDSDDLSRKTKGDDNLLTDKTYSFYIYIDNCNNPKPILVDTNANVSQKTSDKIKNYLEIVVGYYNWEGSYKKLSNKISK